MHIECVHVYIEHVYESTNVTLHICGLNSSPDFPTERFRQPIVNKHN